MRGRNNNRKSKKAKLHLHQAKPSHMPNIPSAMLERVRTRARMQQSSPELHVSLPVSSARFGLLSHRIPAKRNGCTSPPKAKATIINEVTTFHETEGDSSCNTNLDQEHTKMRRPDRKPNQLDCNACHKRLTTAHLAATTSPRTFRAFRTPMRA